MKLTPGRRVHVKPQQADRIGLPGVTIRGAEAVVVRVVEDLVLVELVYRAGRRLLPRERLVVRRQKPTQHSRRDR